MSAKDLGDYAELRFTLSAFENGFSILRPFADSRPYDYVLEKGGRFIKVQVKSCNVPISAAGRFHIGVSRGHKTKKIYTKSDTDIIAVYLRTINTFYIIPIDKITAKNIRLYPFKDHHFNIYKENWAII